MISKKIILGTAQFGQIYGVTNNRKNIKFDEIKKIILFCKKKKIQFIDTAQEYGRSEKILGACNVKNFKIITKIKIKNSQKNLYKLIKNSEKALKVNKIYGVLVHNHQVLLNKNGHQLFEELNKLKKKKLISKIGVSIYKPKEFTKLKKKGFKFDIIQIPFSIFDKRFLKNNTLKKIKDTGAEIHARSIFLQGLLLQDISNIPVKFKKWKSAWVRWNNFIAHNKLKKLNVCLNFALKNKYIDKVILGFFSRKEIEDIFLVYKKLNYNLINKNFTNDVKLINPTLW